MTWRPLSARHSPDPEHAFDALHEGIPDWIEPSIQPWLRSQFTVLEDFAEEVVLTERLHEMERRLHLRLQWIQGGHGALAHLLKWRDEKLLDVIDLALRWIGESGGHDFDDADRLERILSQGGSAWMVLKSEDGDKVPWCLVRRVSSTVAEAAHDVIGSSGRAGLLLAESWRHVYGRNPNPSSGYREAVRAVEVAACPVVLPKEPTTATLGKVIKALNNAPTGKFISELRPPDGTPIQVVASMMNLLWKSQLDRHGTADESVPLMVSQPEAEMALHLAVTLVHWFSAKLVSQSST